MKNVAKALEWQNKHIKNPDGTPKVFKFNVETREPETNEDRIVICGSEQRVNDLIGQRLAAFPNSRKLKFDDATTEDAALQIITKCIEDAPNATLTGTRGEGVNAKAGERDKLVAIMSDPSMSQADKLTALAGLGYKL